MGVSIKSECFLDYVGQPILSTNFTSASLTGILLRSFRLSQKWEPRVAFLVETSAGQLQRKCWMLSSSSSSKLLLQKSLENRPSLFAIRSNRQCPVIVVTVNKKVFINRLSRWLGCALCRTL